jgi:hypothetical protein
VAQRPGIFPTFFLSGFECSTFLWGKDRVRRNLVAETGHDRHAADDYQMLNRLGIAVAREGIPWPMVDKAGEYDFTILDPFIEAMNAAKIISSRRSTRSPSFPSAPANGAGPHPTVAAARTGCACGWRCAARRSPA